MSCDLLKKIPKEGYKSVVAILKDSLSDPRRFHECILEFEIRGLSRAADTAKRFQHDLIIIGAFLLNIEGGYKQQSSSNALGKNGAVREGAF
jgi:hypothetical protein